MTRCLVIGGDGLIGKLLFAFLQKQNVQVMSTSRRSARQDQVYLDLCHPEQAQFPEVDLAFFCAGLTNIAECEQNPDQTSKINVDASFAVIKKLVDKGTRVIYISSSTVFDGTQDNPDEDAETNGKVVYGLQKIEIEKQLLRYSDKVSIVRITKLITPAMPIVQKIYSSLKSNQKLELFDDLMMSPISSNYLCDSLWKIAQSSKGGVFHLSGEESVSYADFAIAMSIHLHADPDLVCRTAAKNVLHKPRYAGLGMDRAKATLGLKPQHLAKVLSDLIDNEPCV